MTGLTSTLQPSPNVLPPMETGRTSYEFPGGARDQVYDWQGPPPMTEAGTFAPSQNIYEPMEGPSQLAATSEEELRGPDYAEAPEPERAATSEEELRSLP